MGALTKTPIILVLLLATIIHTQADNCSYALYSRARTFTHKATTGLPDLRTCQWRITVASDEKIVLNLTDMFIPKSPNCTQGAVEVRDGYWPTSPLLGRFCGGGDSSLTFTNSILSSSNKLLISYSNRNAGVGQGFVASYEGICGGTLFVENSTTFASPNYPGLYPFKKKCIWRIVVPDDHRVALSFTSFSVEYQSSCVYDYVDVLEGPLLNRSLIGRYCNARLPPPTIISGSNEVLVKFVSDSSLPLRGFQATVRRDFDECSTNLHGCAQLCINTVESFKCACYPGWELHSNGKWCEPACGGNLTADFGSIQSPSYPSVYPPNRSCLWNIRTLYESKIRMDFTAFSLENGVINGTSLQCTKDWVKVTKRGRGNPLAESSQYCQGNATSDSLQETTYCGVASPGTVYSEGNHVTVVFKSDATIQRNGFLMTYATELERCLINNGNCHHGCLNNGTSVCVCPANYTTRNGLDCGNGNCLFEISSLTGVINSPNYPNNYPISKNCAWKLRTTPGHRLNITFQAFQLENNTNCGFDNVILYDGPSIANKSLGKFCGSVIPQQLNTSSNELYVTFKSDGSNVFRGFQATYATVCGGTLTADSSEKYIYSHASFGYDNYDNRVQCEWTLKAPPGKRVTVAFLSFFLESGSCGFDYVEILEKTGVGLTSLGRYCWHVKPPRICSSGDTLVIRFKTDSSVVSKGFSLVYKATE